MGKNLYNIYRSYSVGSKYHNEKVIVDGIAFASRKESRRYEELKLLQRAGKISSLELQKKYELIPAQYEADIKGVRGGIKKGKLIERSVNYIADFVYTDNETGKIVVEDTKGVRTPEFIIKRKLMLYRHNIRVKEL